MPIEVAPSPRIPPAKSMPKPAMSCAVFVPIFERGKPKPAAASAVPVVAPSFIQPSTPILKPSYTPLPYVKLNPIGKQLYVPCVSVPFTPTVELKKNSLSQASTALLGKVIAVPTMGV